MGKKDTNLEQNENKNEESQNANASQFQDNTASANDSNETDRKDANVGDDNKDNEVVNLKAEIEDWKNKYLRLMADFQNYQKRIEGEKAMFGAIANLSLIQDILEVFDDMTLALQDEALNVDSAKSSMKTAQDKLIAAAEKAGIERIEVKVGDEFNKETMEAITTTPVEDEKQKGKVVAVINSAFKYKDREGIIKAAKVIVGK